MAINKCINILNLFRLKVEVRGYLPNLRLSLDDKVMAESQLGEFGIVLVNFVFRIRMCCVFTS